MGKEGGHLPRPEQAGAAEQAQPRPVSRRVIVGREAARLRLQEPQYAQSPFFVRSEYEDGRVGLAYKFTRVTVHHDGTETRQLIPSPALADMYGGERGGRTTIVQQDGSTIAVDVYQLLAKGTRAQKQEIHESFVLAADDDGYEVYGARAEPAPGTIVGEHEEDRLYKITYLVRKRPSPPDAANG